MQHVLLTVFGWLTALVAVVALVAGPNDAARIAGTGMATVGITVGAIVGGIDNLTAGFMGAKDAGPVVGNRNGTQRSGLTTDEQRNTNNR